MDTPLGDGPVVVGVRRRQQEPVIEAAAVLAARLRTTLLCVAVDPSMVSVGGWDGSELIQSIDPDVAQIGPDPLPEDLTRRIETVAGRHGVPVDVRTEVGDAALRLARVAEEVDAALVVVGARTGRHRVVEFFNGSVAARLSHQQRRPVVVVPTDPVRPGQPLPWTTS